MDLHVYTTDAASLSWANFNDSRCEYGCVGTTDPLLFTCELNNVFGLRVVLPNGFDDTLSSGDGLARVDHLPDGFNALSLNISEIKKSGKIIRIISLTLSIVNASLLDNGVIICDDTNPNIKVMAGCRVCGKF